MRSKQAFLTRQKALDTDYDQYKPWYTELSTFLLNHRGRFLVNDKKLKRNTSVINNKARLACRITQGGLMAGITSPARPWFKLAHPNHEMMKNKQVRIWLAHVETIMRAIFNQSNVYNSLHTLYGELVTFATCPIGVYQDFENVIHTMVYTVGSYRVAADESGKIIVFYRAYELSVDQCMKKWGPAMLSSQVNELFRKGMTEQRVQLLHVIEPNDDRDHMNPASWHKPIRSVHIELTAGDVDEIKIKSGFDTHPILCPRWSIQGEDTYGNDCPGMDCLGDTKALQLGERRSAQAIDKMVDPPLQAPTGFARYQGAGLLPGDIVIGDDPAGKGMRSVYDVNLSVKDHEEKLRSIEDRIDKAYYVDLFMMIANDYRSGITAREIAEKHEEKLLQLGPVLERLHTELLSPLIDRTFNIMQSTGILPPPPPELVDVDLTVEYVSVLAQAQRMTLTQGLNEFTGFIANMATIWPEAKHKVNVFEVVNQYADSMMVHPDILNDNDEAQAAADAERQAQTMAQMAEMAPKVAKAGLDASQINPNSKIAQQQPVAA